MSFSQSIPTRRNRLLRSCVCVLTALAIAVVVISRGPHSFVVAQPLNPYRSAEVTDIAIGPEILHADVKRFGINLSGQTFYDSGQMLKNLTFRNPGFEGETWASNLRCKTVTLDTCTDENEYSVWPAGFLNGASFEILSGTAKGTTGTIRQSSAAGRGRGVTLTFATDLPGLAASDFLQVHADKPGDAQAGWWTSTNGGATCSTEFRDLAPDTLGRQALRVDANGPGKSATVNSYFDSTEGHSFVQLRGRFALRFRAKWLAGEKTLPVTVGRITRPGTPPYFQKNVAVTPNWHSYSFEFSANEQGHALGTVGLTFSVQQSTVLLDDVEVLSIGGSPANPTAFRDEVVDALRELHPGVLRFMDNGTSFGSTLDDLLTPPFGRRRGGSLETTNRNEDIPIGLHESLVLAQAIHAEPWYTLPATFSPDEIQNLMEYLAGPASTPYGRRRAALGQSVPWTSVFPVIHLEFGNEMWGSFPGSAIANPGVYAARASILFSAARASKWFRDASFDLIGDAQAENPWWTSEALKVGTQQTSIDFAPYLFGTFNDASSTEAIFGPMFAQPEQLDTSNGLMVQQVKAVRSAQHAATPAVYEVNLSTDHSASKTITQGDIERTVPSQGGALAVADHMLLMLRELGITNECLFALPEYTNRFTSPGDTRKTTPLWGAVVDMGGATNLRRPSFYALELANQAILSHELTTHLTGANPTWNQPASTNDGVQAGHPHLLQVFAFGDGAKRSVILLNLSRTSSLPVTFSGPGQPAATVTESRLTAANITDNNEHERKVSIVKHNISDFKANTPYELPPFSMTALAWQAAR